MSNPKAVILIRVSSRKQETDRQLHELTQAAVDASWDVVEVIEEKKSGKADEKDREGLERVRALVKRGGIQKVMVHEVSRISRRNSITHKFVEDMTHAGVSIYWYAQKQETLLPDGSENPLAGFLISIFAEQAKYEIATMGARVRSGLEEARRKGKIIGRRPGRWDRGKFLARHRKAAEEIRRSPELTNDRLALLSDVSVNTIRKVRRVLAGLDAVA
jgi:DNA invertase Pin-like site-specific DNA recombinase